MPRNKNYRERISPRTKGWDYSQTAAYFITICTENREPFFGEIRKGLMGLSRIGLIVHWFWQKLPDQFSHVELDEYIVMPNHIHGILTVYEKNRDAINRVPIDDIDGFQKIPGGATGRHNPMLLGGNLGKVIRWFKGRCTYEIRKRGHHQFQWQGRYWDKIIKDEGSLSRIREYIYNNPLKWESDQLNKTDFIQRKTKSIRN